MSYPSLGTWNEKRPNEAEADAVAVAEAMSWAAIDQLTAGRVAFSPITVRPIVAENDGTVHLDGPVGGVKEVRIDGLVFAGWDIVDGRLLRLDGNAWPTNDDMTDAPLSVGTFEVTYWQGWRPGRLLLWAAGELAAEFYKAASGDKACRLPKGVTSVTRQGVSFEISKPLFSEGQTGIREIDVVLGRYNPQRTVAQTVIASPESIARAPRRY